MVKVPTKFYLQNQKSFFGLFAIILILLTTTGYFVKSYYHFPDVQSMEAIFFSTILLFFLSVQIVFRKKIKEFNKKEDNKKSTVK